VAHEYKNAITEWVYRGEHFKYNGKCCCGHIIQNNLIVRNDRNNRTLVVGNCCINKFGINRKSFNGSKMAYLELGLSMAMSLGSRDYLKYETLKRVKAGQMFTALDIRVLEQVTGRKSRFKPYDPSKGVCG
jgi:hypothetical protein